MQRKKKKLNEKVFKNLMEIFVEEQSLDFMNDISL